MTCCVWQDPEDSFRLHEPKWFATHFHLKPGSHREENLFLMMILEKFPRSRSHLTGIWIQNTLRFPSLLILLKWRNEVPIPLLFHFTKHKRYLLNRKISHGRKEKCQEKSGVELCTSCHRTGLKYLPSLRRQKNLNKSKSKCWVGALQYLSNGLTLHFWIW